MKPQKIDKDMSWELVLWITNNESLHKQCRCCALNLAKKIHKGAYDADKAPKIFVHPVKRAITEYRREVGPIRLVNAATKLHAARDLLDSYQEDIAELVERLNAGEKIQMHEVTQ